MNKFEILHPLIEGEMESSDDGFNKSRSFLFWDKQIMKLYYEWGKAGMPLNPNVRITLEERS